MQLATPILTDLGCVLRAIHQTASPTGHGLVGAVDVDRNVDQVEERRGYGRVHRLPHVLDLEVNVAVRPPDAEPERVLVSDRQGAITHGPAQDGAFVSH